MNMKNTYRLTNRGFIASNLKTSYFIWGSPYVWWNSGTLESLHAYLSASNFADRIETV